MFVYVYFFCQSGWTIKLEGWRGLQQAGVEAFVLAGSVMLTVVVADSTWCMGAGALRPPCGDVGVLGVLARAWFFCQIAVLGEVTRMLVGPCCPCLQSCSSHYAALTLRLLVGWACPVHGAF